MVIDAHLHLWNTERLPYEWLQRPENAAINRTFGVEDFRSLAARAGVDRAVLVQAADTAADTEAMFEIASAHPEIAGVVAWVPLDRPDEAAIQLDRLAARPGFAGIRNLIHDQPDPDWLLRPPVGDGLALLEQQGIPFDVISVLPRHLATCRCYPSGTRRCGWSLITWPTRPLAAPTRWARGHGLTPRTGGS